LITVDVQFMLYLTLQPDLNMGKKTITIEINEGSTFGELLKELAEKYGPSLSKEIYDPQRQTLRDMVMVTINGQLLHTLNGLNTVLQQGDRVIFVPLIMGG
jgi:molybdopterin converting factor small subunit